MPSQACRRDRHRETDITGREREAREEEEKKIEAGGSGGHSPQEGAGAAEELRHVARIR